MSHTPLIGTRLVKWALGAVCVFAACSPPDTPTVRISGSSTLLPVIAKAAERHDIDHGDIRVIVNGGGSGVGLQQLASGQSDIGMLSRDITADEYARYSDIQFTVQSIGHDAVIPVVSSEIYEQGVTALTLDDIAAIYRGEITNWQTLNGPDLDILVIDKEASRGTRQVFMAAILGDKRAKAAGADLVLGSNNEEQTALAQSDRAIGMLSFAWLNADVRGLDLIAADGTRLAPTRATIAAGTFPIARDLLLVTRSDASPAAEAIIAYMLGPVGQDLVEEVGYVRRAP